MTNHHRLQGSQGADSEEVATMPVSEHRVMVALDESPHSCKAIPYAAAVANALGAELSLVHILEPAHGSAAGSDPVEWQLYRKAAQSRLERLARQQSREGMPISVNIEEGRPDEQVCRLAHDLAVNLTVLCNHRTADEAGRGIGATARSVIDHSNGSVLIVPSEVEDDREVHFRRIMVPLDGSSRAESALPMAIRVAAAEGAELILIHAVPQSEFTEFGPPQPEDDELRSALLRRNERVAEQYLGRVRANLADKDVPLRSVILRGGDIRYLLLNAMAEERVDLVVMSSHGHSGHATMSTGSTAIHLCSHTSVPVLLVRNRLPPRSNGGTGNWQRFSRDLRFPSRMAS